MPLKRLPAFMMLLMVVSCGQPKNDNAFEKAKKLNDERKFKEAIILLTPFIKDNPHFDSAYIERSFAYANIFDYKKAINDYNHLIATPKHRVFGLQNRGSVYTSMGEYKKALEDFNRAIEIDSTNAYGYYLRGIAHSNLFTEDNSGFHDYKNALLDLNKSIELDSTVIEAFIERGNLLLNMEKYDEALSDFNRSILMDTTYYLSYVSRGVFYSKIKSNELALKDFNKSIALNPKEPNVYVERGFFYLYNLKNKNKACEDFGQARELGYTEDPDIIETPCEEGY